jgi:hypothetical protein
MSSANHHCKPRLPIDLSAETPLSLKQAARKFPPLRSCRPVNPSTILRWIVRGIRLSGGGRVRLEAIRAGGAWVTSQQAIDRFVESQTQDRLGHCEPTPRTTRQRQLSTERAREELRRAGIAKAV